MSEDMKPCPFPMVPHGIDYPPRIEEDDGWFVVYCPSCRLASDRFATEDEAIAWWNTRAITSDVEKVIHDAAIEAVLNVGDAAKYGATDLDRHIQAAIAAVKARRGGKL